MIGVLINNKRTTALERTTALAGGGGGGGGGLNAFYWYQMFALDSAVDEAQARMESSGCQDHSY